jgi:hypothetical protein
VLDDRHGNRATIGSRQIPAKRFRLIHTAHKRELALVQGLVVASTQFFAVGDPLQTIAVDTIDCDFGKLGPRAFPRALCPLTVESITTR